MGHSCVSAVQVHFMFLGYILAFSYYSGETAFIVVVAAAIARTSALPVRHRAKLIEGAGPRMGSHFKRTTEASHPTAATCQM